MWHLRLTFHFLADAGNLLDCACLAGIVALRHFRKPDIEVIGEQVIMVRLSMTPSDHVIYSLQHSPTERAPVPLAIHHSPFCFTFAFFPDASIPPVLDPSQLEQRLSAGLVSMALNAQKEICVLQKLGGVPLGADDVLRLVDIAVVKAKEMNDLVEARLREDWTGRKVEIR